MAGKLLKDFKDFGFYNTFLTLIIHLNENSLNYTHFTPT